MIDSEDALSRRGRRRAADRSEEGADLPPPPRIELSRAALFADLDGTLADLKATPAEVAPDAGRRRLLDALQASLDGRLAVVSGRGLDDLDRVLEGRVSALAGVHGLVRRMADGVVTAPPAASGVAEAVRDFNAFAAADPGLLVENKQAAAALHYRRSPEAAAACRALAAQLASRLGLLVQDGDMVVEVRARGPDKGGAVRAFMGEPPFAGAMPIFVGDDLTDEHGFRAARALGGYGVIVGSRRPTLADYALRDVAATMAWLGGSLKGTA